MKIYHILIFGAHFHKYYKKLEHFEISFNSPFENKIKRSGGHLHIHQQGREFPEVKTHQNSHDLVNMLKRFTYCHLQNTLSTLQFSYFSILQIFFILVAQ